jgi:thiamine biosynthesis lipoprotein
MACGLNQKAESPWEIGILHPNSTRDSLFFIAYASLQNKSFTTSGNYFNYKIENGKKYSHTIDPVSGFPIQQALLSASVFANDGSTADGWATAFMVMGHERAIEILKEQTDLEAFLVFATPDGEIDTYITEGIKPFIKFN